MFRRHDDRLQQLNDELLAEDEEYTEEYEDEEYETYDSEDLDETDIADLLGEEDGDEASIPLFRNHANKYGDDLRNYANHYGKGSPMQFDDEDYEQDEDLYDDEFLYRDDYRRAKKDQKKARKAEIKAKRKERKGKLGLAILALIELIAIGGIIAWWISWIV